MQAKTDPSSWRKLMTREELDAFDKGQPLPTEATRITRDRHEVSYNPEYLQHQPGSQNGCDPALQTYHRQCIEAVDGFAGVPENCQRCGKRLSGDVKEKRATILIHEGKDQNRAVVFCHACFANLNLPLETKDDWRDGLSQLHVQVWELYSEGLPQKEIAARLSNQHRHINQRKVSRLLAEVRNRHHQC